MSPYLVQNSNMCTFGIFLSKFGCHSNSLCSLENSDSICQFAIRKPYYSQPHRKNFWISSTELKSVQFWLILLKCGCPGNSLWSLENSDSIYLNSLTLKTLLLTPKIISILYRTEICAILAFLPKFRCHGNALCSLKYSDSIFELYNPENTVVYAEINCHHIAYRTEICAFLDFFV